MTGEVNPLGLIVGGDEHQPMMVVARGPDGATRRIHKVERGRACACSCIECGTPVIARQGKYREWSFAHAARSDCVFGLETLAHHFAKQVIADEGGLFVASVKRWGQLHPKFVQLEGIKVEERMAGFRADLVGKSGHRELIIEVKVTHPCSSRKIRAYEKIGLSVLEIDLAPFRFKSAEVLRQAVLRDASRYWLCLSGGRPVPLRPSNVSSGGKSYGGVQRPSHVSSQEWEAMSALQRVNAFDPDGRLAIRSKRF